MPGSHSEKSYPVFAQELDSKKFEKTYPVFDSNRVVRFEQQAAPKVQRLNNETALRESELCWLFSWTQ